MSEADASPMASPPTQAVNDPPASEISNDGAASPAPRSRSPSVPKSNAGSAYSRPESKRPSRDNTPQSPESPQSPRTPRSRSNSADPQSPLSPTYRSSRSSSYRPTVPGSPSPALGNTNDFSPSSTFAPISDNTLTAAPAPPPDPAPAPAPAARTAPQADTRAAPAKAESAWTGHHLLRPTAVMENRRKSIERARAKPPLPRKPTAAQTAVGLRLYKDSTTTTRCRMRHKAGGDADGSFLDDDGSPNVQMVKRHVVCIHEDDPVAAGKPRRKRLKWSAVERHVQRVYTNALLSKFESMIKAEDKAYESQRVAAVRALSKSLGEAKAKRFVAERSKALEAVDIAAVTARLYPSPHELALMRAIATAPDVPPDCVAWEHIYGPAVASSGASAARLGANDDDADGYSCCDAPKDSGRPTPRVRRPLKPSNIGDAPPLWLIEALQAAAAADPYNIPLLTVPPLPPGLAEGCAVDADAAQSPRPRKRLVAKAEIDAAVEAKRAAEATARKAFRKARKAAIAAGIPDPIFEYDAVGALAAQRAAEAAGNGSSAVLLAAGGGGTGVPPSFTDAAGATGGPLAAMDAEGSAVSGGLAGLRSRRSSRMGKGKMISSAAISAVSANSSFRGPSAAPSAAPSSSASSTTDGDGDSDSDSSSSSSTSSSSDTSSSAAAAKPRGSADDSAAASAGASSPQVLGSPAGNASLSFSAAALPAAALPAAAASLEPHSGAAGSKTKTAMNGNQAAARRSGSRPADEQGAVPRRRISRGGPPRTATGVPLAARPTHSFLSSHPNATGPLRPPTAPQRTASRIGRGVVAGGADGWGGGLRPALPGSAAGGGGRLAHPSPSFLAAGAGGLAAGSYLALGSSLNVSASNNSSSFAMQPFTIALGGSGGSGGGAGGPLAGYARALRGTSAAADGQPGKGRGASSRGARAAKAAEATAGPLDELLAVSGLPSAALSTALSRIEAAEAAMAAAAAVERARPTPLATLSESRLNEVGGVHPHGKGAGGGRGGTLGSTAVDASRWDGPIGADEEAMLELLQKARLIRIAAPPGGGAAARGCPSGTTAVQMSRGLRWVSLADGVDPAAAAAAAVLAMGRQVEPLIQRLGVMKSDGSVAGGERADSAGIHGGDGGNREAVAVAEETAARLSSGGRVSAWVPTGAGKLRGGLLGARVQSAITASRRGTMESVGGTRPQTADGTVAGKVGLMRGRGLIRQTVSPQPRTPAEYAGGSNDENWSEIPISRASSPGLADDALSRLSLALCRISVLDAPAEM